MSTEKPDPLRVLAEKIAEEHSPNSMYRYYLRSAVEAALRQVRQQTLEACAPYMQHLGGCVVEYCQTCGARQGYGHHEDSYNGDTSWHEFKAKDCTCGLAAFRSGQGEG